MERVTILPVDIGQIKSAKVSSSALPNSSDNKRDNFSQVLAERIQRKRNENSVQNGKEANSGGKKTTEANPSAKNQSANHVAENKQTTVKKSTIDKNSNDQARNVDKSEKNETSLQSQEDVEQQAQQSEVNNEYSEEKKASDENDVDEKLTQADQQPLKSEVLETSEQLLLLLQNADKTLTTVVNKNVLDESDTSDNVLNKTLDQVKQIIQGLSTKQDKESVPELVQQSLVNDGELQQGEVKNTSAQDAVIKFNTETSETNSQLLEPKSQSLIDMMNASKLLEGDDSKDNSDKGLSDEQVSSTFKKLSTTANLNAGVSVGQTNEQGDKVSKAEALTIEKLSDDLLSGKQLTKEQLAQIALLKSTLDQQHKGETPPIVVNDPINEFTNKSKLSDAIAKSLSTNTTDSAAKQSDNIITEKSSEKSIDTPINQLPDAGKVTLSADNNKAVAEQFVLQPSDDLSHIDESTGYSEGELRDIQSLHAASAKVTETNVQSQKVELTNKIDTIALHRKDFTTALQDKVMIMVQQKIQQVDIRLDPPELGHMQVRLNLHNDQANVQFIVQNQQAKEALDQNLNKLKEMLSQQGVNVGDANVGQRSNNQASADNQQGQLSQQNGNFFGDENIDDESFEINSQTFSANLVKGSAVGVDYYA